MFKKILIANRGEIACRIVRTARAMGISAATVHSSADANALHVSAIGESVFIGGGPARESYLDIDAVIGAARKVGADAIHPGFGFLSENAVFAQRCADEGLRFIGPAPPVLALFGDKAQAKNLASHLGIPTAGGLEEPSDDATRLIAALNDLPLPYILKAVSGGGGKGMRVVRDKAALREAIEGAIREGRASFGDGRLIAESYLIAPRHIEVQILGDGKGNVIHLLDRECTLQRRHQKVIEEAPASSIVMPLREQLWRHAVALGQATNYLGLGTVEFAVTDQGAVFLEVNPRLQVEHTVTEAVTGLDLVELQIRAVYDGALPLQQVDVAQATGVAIQARLYAEDAEHGFAPSTGELTAFRAPDNARVDAGVETGSVITPYYDPMIAKIIVHQPNRTLALAGLRTALDNTVVLGVVSNRRFLIDLIADDKVSANEVSTEYIDTWLAAQPPTAVAPRDVAAVMALWLVDQRAATVSPDAWHDGGTMIGWRAARLGGRFAGKPTWKARGTDGEWAVGFGASQSNADIVVRVDDELFSVSLGARNADSDRIVSVDGLAQRVHWTVAGNRMHARVGMRELALDLEPLYSEQSRGSASVQGLVRAPMMGQVIAVHVRAGQSVAAGERLATMESMKMEMAISAPMAGVVKAVGCEAGAKAERNQELFRIEA